MSETVSARGIDLNSTATKDTVLGLEAARDLDAVDSVVPPEANNRLSPDTAGGRLRAAREAVGMSVADVAEILRFGEHQIDALERDDHAHLAGTTLVRGMIRGYAKLLKIKPEPLLVGLGSEIPVSVPDVRAPTNIGLADKATTVARFSRGVVVALAIVVVLFVAVAGYAYLMSDVPVRRVASAGAEAPIAAPSQVAPLVQMPAVVPDASVATAPPAEMAAISPSANALIIDFDELSWIEITDASQSIVFRGEQPKGTHQVIEGKPPYQLWIGRASAVRVSFGDRVIDLKPYSRENIARLTIE